MRTPQRIGWAAPLLSCALAVPLAALPLAYLRLSRPAHARSAGHLAHTSSVERDQLLAAMTGAHGGLHDPRAEAAIASWIARGRPDGAALLAVSQEAPPDRTITIRTRGSNLDFEPASISAKAGSRLRIRYINEGVLPHNLVVIHDEDDLDALGVAAYEAEETGFVPLALKDKMIAWTKLAAPDETVEVTFVVPPAGEYTMVCLFPGHYNVMLGTLRSLG